MVNALFPMPGNYSVHFSNHWKNGFQPLETPQGGGSLSAAADGEMSFPRPAATNGFFRRKATRR